MYLFDLNVRCNVNVGTTSKYQVNPILTYILLIAGAKYLYNFFRRKLAAVLHACFSASWLSGSGTSLASDVEQSSVFYEHWPSMK